jgi:hypothetical protein
MQVVAFRPPWVALTFVSLFIPSQCPSTPTGYTLSAGHRTTIRAEVLTPVSHVRDLPPTVREALTAHFGESTLTLADPGEPIHSHVWQLLRSSKTPSRRLIAAGYGPDHCLVHYEEAGYRPSFRVLLFGLNRSDAQVEWTGVSSRPLADVGAVKDLVLQE